MAAERFQQAGTAFERFINVDVVDGARGALLQIPALDKEDGRAVEFFRNARRDDADQARVPALVAEHDDVAERALLFQFLLGLPLNKEAQS